jgi:hypothetical protein
MNRFDRDFNDTDPITHRPFSDGHPDGVWIIVILLGIPLFAAMLAILISAIMCFSASPWLAYRPFLLSLALLPVSALFLFHLFFFCDGCR